MIFSNLTKIKRLFLGIALLNAALGPVFLHAHAQEVPKELAGVGIQERLGDEVTINGLRFRDEEGHDVPLSQYFQRGKPVLLQMGYYGCASLCSFVLNGVVDSLKKFPWTPGREFELVSVSIDAKEGPDLAKKKKAAYIQAYGKPEAAQGWHFLTGSEENIQKLAQQVGFGFRYDEQEKQFAHGAGLMVLTPEGKVSRYLYGIEYPRKDLRLALLEASSGRIGSVIDRIVMFCFRYDPHTRKYSVYATRVIQAGSGLMIIALAAYMALFWRRERQERESVSHV